MSEAHCGRCAHRHDRNHVAQRQNDGQGRVGRIGRSPSYVYATWATSADGLAVAAFFDVGWAGKAVFAVWAISWSAATALALRRARAHRFGEHREWMLRSFALALVFLTFDIARSGLTDMGLPRTVVYPLGLALCATLSLAAVELWIRRTRTGSPIAALP